MIPEIALSEDQIADFCRKHHIRKLSLFGSVLRADFGDDSDIDVLVEFEPDHTPDLFLFVEMQDELSQLLGREVDLNTAGFLSRHFRDKVVNTAQVIYG
jgi:uncharacterized protein